MGPSSIFNGSNSSHYRVIPVPIWQMTY